MEKCIVLRNDYGTKDELFWDDVDLEITWKECESVNYEITNVEKTEELITVFYKVVNSVVNE